MSRESCQNPLNNTVATKKKDSTTTNLPPVVPAESNGNTSTFYLVWCGYLCVDDNCIGIPSHYYHQSSVSGAPSVSGVQQPSTLIRVPSAGVLLTTRLEIISKYNLRRDEQNPNCVFKERCFIQGLMQQ